MGTVADASALVPAATWAIEPASPLMVAFPAGTADVTVDVALTANEASAQIELETESAEDTSTTSRATDLDTPDATLAADEQSTGNECMPSATIGPFEPGKNIDGHTLVTIKDPLLGCFEPSKSSESAESRQEGARAVSITAVAQAITVPVPLAPEAPLLVRVASANGPPKPDASIDQIENSQLPLKKASLIRPNKKSKTPRGLYMIDYAKQHPKTTVDDFDKIWKSLDNETVQTYQAKAASLHAKA